MPRSCVMRPRWHPRPRPRTQPKRRAEVWLANTASGVSKASPKQDKALQSLMYQDFLFKRSNKFQFAQFSAVSLFSAVVSWVRDTSTHLSVCSVDGKIWVRVVHWDLWFTRAAPFSAFGQARQIRREENVAFGARSCSDGSLQSAQSPRLIIFCNLPSGFD